ncbi:hypothetical protein Tco_0626507 [Tanacetum coccineum]|uniref:Biogenesis of lysosome-related organelles complex 1 subunit 7 n=1 Tax=Tanacetum coccineum TaxID=301880 RepID=A0ABQ4WJT2_9ASTR
MLDDETESVSKFETNDNDEDDHSENKEEISQTAEADANNVIDELVDMVNSKDDNVNDYANKLTELDPFGHLKADINSLPTKVENLESSLSLVKKTLRAEVPEIILKPLNKEFNALNKMESQRVPRDIMVIKAKRLQTNIEKNASDILELVNLIKELVRLIDQVPSSTNAAIEGENVSTQAQSDHVMNNEPTAEAQGEQQ